MRIPANTIKVGPTELKELLQNPKFVAYAPNFGKTVGGWLAGKFYFIKRAA